GLARPLRVPDATELGLVLRPAPRLEELPVGRDLDAVPPQVVRNLERERRRHRGALDAELRACTASDLELDLGPPLPGRVQLVLAELGGREDLELGRVLANAWNFKSVDRNRSAPVLLEVEERVADRNRNLVPKLGRPNRVAADENVGHVTILTAPATLNTPRCIDSNE